MQLNYLGLAVPFFLFFMGLEYYFSRKKGKNFFQYAESVANINVGIAERLLDIFTTGMFYFVFLWVYQNFALFDIKANVWTWILLFLATDFVWYWYHRLAHEINVFWAAHVVHHQSEDFNYTVSARITVFQAIIRSGFWCFLPLLGFPPAMTTALLLVHGLYPFFVHTQTLGKWGFFEKFMVTPTHHGIHHASNPEYLDKNYGDVLIIWDKMFGTFAEEKKEVKIQYGLTSNLNSYSFLWQHFHFILEIYLNFKHAKGGKAKWRTVFGKPDELDPRYRTVLERKLAINSHFKNESISPVIRQYVAGQTAVSLLILCSTILFEHYLSGWQLVLLSAFIVVSVINSGAMLDRRQWILYLEYVRLLIVLVAIATFYPNIWTVTAVAGILLVLIWFFKPIQRSYLTFLYAKNG